MKRIIVLIILVHLTLSSISQISDSVTCIPNSKLRKAIKEIENCKVLREELAATQSSVSILQDKVDLRDHIIYSYEVKDSLSEARILNMQSIIQIKDREILNGKSIETIQSIKIKTLKINKWLYGGAGFVVGILVKLILK